ncbi:MAG: DUF2752 domain-containing protein [Acidobacteriota bacterium]
MNGALSTNGGIAETRLKQAARPRAEARHVLGILAFSMLALGRLLDPRQDPRWVAIAGIGIPSSCGFRLATGLPCPSCGLTRSVCFSMHGDLRSAFRLHPMGPLVTLGAVVQGLFLLMTLLVPRLARRVPMMPIVYVYFGYVAAIFVCGVLRYVGVFPLPPA